jgi:hypothetical protein
MEASVELDAREFGLHTRQGGWRLGLLVARNVEPGKGQNERGSRRSNRNDEKISAKKFADLAGTTAARVMRYWRAWEEAADKDIVPSSAGLTPGEEVDLDVDELPDWSDYYDASTSSGSSSGGSGSSGDDDEDDEDDSDDDGDDDEDEGGEETLDDVFINPMTTVCIKTRTMKLDLREFNLTESQRKTVLNYLNELEEHITTIREDIEVRNRRRIKGKTVYVYEVSNEREGAES